MICWKSLGVDAINRHGGARSPCESYAGMARQGSKATIKPDSNEDTGISDRLDHGVALLQRHRQRFLDEDRFAPAGGFHSQARREVVACSDRHGVHGRVIENIHRVGGIHLGTEPVGINLVGFAQGRCYRLRLTCFKRFDESRSFLDAHEEAAGGVQPDRCQQLRGYRIPVPRRGRIGHQPMDERSASLRDFLSENGQRHPESLPDIPS
jgi:hypothetical protein